MIATIFDLCIPKPDVLTGNASDSDYAADLAQVIRGYGGPSEYNDPAKFFLNTYPTRGLRSLLRNVCGRISGQGGAVAAIFRLDTSFGGGKTHGLIALVHAARGMSGLTDPSEFIDPSLIPRKPVRIALLAGADLIHTMSTPGVWSEKDLDHILGKYGVCYVPRSRDMDQEIWIKRYLWD